MTKCISLDYQSCKQNTATWLQVATMWMVTEHLPNNRAVVEGIFQWTKPGDLLALKHHNYYGFDGHHQKLGDGCCFCWASCFFGLSNV